MGKVAGVAGGLVLGAVLVLVVPAWLRHDDVAHNDALFVGGLGSALLALGGVFLLFPGRAR